jgi:hypothetical protein
MPLSRLYAVVLWHWQDFVTCWPKIFSCYSWWGDASPASPMVYPRLNSTITWDLVHHSVLINFAFLEYIYVVLDSFASRHCINKSTCSWRYRGRLKSQISCVNKSTQITKLKWKCSIYDQFTNVSVIIGTSRNHYGASAEGRHHETCVRCASTTTTCVRCALQVNA